MQHTYTFSEPYYLISWRSGTSRGKYGKGWKEGDIEEGWEGKTSEVSSQQKKEGLKGKQFWVLLSGAAYGNR